jgi:hypothetical protein
MEGSQSQASIAISSLRALCGNPVKTVAKVVFPKPLFPFKQTDPPGRSSNLIVSLAKGHLGPIDRAWKVTNGRLDFEPDDDMGMVVDVVESDEVDTELVDA